MRLFSTVLLAVLLGGCAPRVAPTSLASDETPTVLVLVRHAEKAAEPAADPPLTVAGEARARALADALADAGVEAVVASQFRRTMETGAPLADRLGVEVETRPLTGDPAEAARTLALDLAVEYRGRTVLVVGHSNTIPTMVNALTGLSLVDLDDSDYDGLYVVVLDGGGPGASARLVHAQVGAPDPSR